MNTKRRGRRRFLKDGAALAGLAVGAMRSASGQTLGSEVPDVRPKDSRSYGERSRYETSGRATVSFGSLIIEPESSAASPDLHTPLQDSIGIITPSPLHYVVMRFRNRAPDIDPRQHRLLIHGLVERPLIFTMEELKRLPSVSRIHFVECAGNTSPYERPNAETVQETHGWTSCSEWTGVQLSLVLKEVGLKKGASWLVAESADAGKHSASIPLEKAMYDALLVYGQNGEAVRPDQGYPLRLLVPGFEGMRNVKWLRRIKVVDQPYMGKSESTGYSILRPNLDGKSLWYNFELGPKSVITFPSGGQRLDSRGYYEITGLAWSGGGAIRRVEVSTDGGRTWKDAQLQEPVHTVAHTRFRLGWNWNGEEAILQSRCTDNRGNVQPSLAEFAKTWGVQPDYFQSTQKNRQNVNHFNAIQPWKVARDGSIHNAIWL
jgi:sulfane dehydrogenase subunit SoxC